MKIPALLVLAFCGALTGCQQLDLTPESDPQRVVSGVVNFGVDTLLPPGTEVVVRVVDTTALGKQNPVPGTELPVVDNTHAVKTERVLGEQVIRSPGVTPVP